MEARFERLERRFNELETQVINIEKDAAVSSERIKMVFNILNEIKTSIKGIADKMDERSQKPAQLLWTMAGGVIVALIIAGIKFL